MKRVYEDYLRDMLENAEKALSFVRGLDYDGFCKDDKAIYAVIRAFEIIVYAPAVSGFGEFLVVDENEQRFQSG